MYIFMHATYLYLDKVNFYYFSCCILSSLERIFLSYMITTRNLSFCRTLAMSTKYRINASYSVQSKIFPKLKAQILQMRYQNFEEGSSFTTEKKNVKFSICHHVFMI